MNPWSANTEGYPFSWLDEVVEVTLNPERNNFKSLGSTDLTDITNRLPSETDRIIGCIKTQAFYLYAVEHVKVVAGHYDQAVRVLLLQAKKNQRHYEYGSPLYTTGEQILAALDEMNTRIHNRYRTYLPELPADETDQGGGAANFLNKVLCALSADQAGILIRAAFDVKLIIGRSFRKVCKAIVPHLSTPWKTDISWDTVRSNSGRPEQRDKEIVITILEKMIENIRGYR